MEQKENAGAIFANSKKKSENSPDFYTKNKINGVLSILSIWKKKDKNGNTYLSYSIKPVDEEVKVSNSTPLDNEQDLTIPF